MSQILGMGVSHYPGLLVPHRAWPNLIQRNVDVGRVSPELFADHSRWPAVMREEWGNDAGAAAAREHERRLLQGFATMRAQLDAFKPDVVLIWGDDQYENFRNDCVPAFCVYMFDELECRPFGGGRRPFKCDESAYGLPPETAIKVRGHKEAASGLCRTLLGEHFDVAYATETRAEAGLAHSFSNTLVFLDREQRGFDYPVLPFHVNCYGNQLLRGARPDLQKGRSNPDISPPSPTPQRCFDIGRATARYFADQDMRVALVASSSWSHGSLTTKNGRLYPDIEADRRLHKQLVSGDFSRWGELSLAEIEEAGQHEVLNWVCLAGAMTELGQQPSMVDLVESHLFNSSKCFALFPAASNGDAVAAEAEAAQA
jgi:hypothetical protein